MKNNKSNFLEQLFESILWQSRLIVLLAVLFSILASLALFVTGSYEIWHTVSHIYQGPGHEPDYSNLLIGVIGAVDLYLIGIVLLIFAFGIYEIFISKIDIARDGDMHNVLEITSLDELKNKILKVVIMVLIVSFFRTVLGATFSTPLEMLYFALAILAVAACIFFLRHREHEE
jgi:uncharacterized protein (TIGR00645 family)